MTNPPDEARASAEPILARVRKHLVESTGYPLELRVARAARLAGASSVDLSRSFVDTVTKKMRETDVVATWTTSSGRAYKVVHLVMECKASPRPWVIFDVGEAVDQDPDYRLELAYFLSSPGPANQHGHRAPRPRPRVSGYDEVETTLFKASRLGTSAAEITFKSERAGTDKADRNGAWDAIQASVSAVRGLTDTDFVAKSNASYETVNVAVFPVVITSGLLFRAFLDQDQQLVVEEIERGDVLLRPTADPELRRCMIVTEASVPALLAEAAKTVNAL